ncbi:MAG TPA: class I SAM-dependent methyltransferase [Candidatus Dormibacteraeota bacterium]|nr:class I SAM-dependent methyltransferase [Candidatus Dormibacteraeota bacterium]
MSVKRFMASQLRKPHGWFGSLVLSRVMNRVNQQIIDSTVALLELSPQHHVLEIGFGGGSGLRQLLERLPQGEVSGIDFSIDMVQQAKGRFRREIAGGRLRVQIGDVSRLPFPDGVFDRVFTINTIYFWRDALQGLGEIRRVLKAGGLTAVSHRSKEKMEKYAVTKYDFRLFPPHEVADLMRQAGFGDVHVDHQDRDKWTDQVIVVGKR